MKMGSLDIPTPTQDDYNPVDCKSEQRSRDGAGITLGSRFMMAPMSATMHVAWGKILVSVIRFGCSGVSRRCIDGVGSSSGLCGGLRGARFRVAAVVAVNGEGAV